MAGRSCWLITDGKMGDLAQCLGVAERLELMAESRVVAPRAPFRWLMPWGGIDPAEAPLRPSSPIAAPFPDLAIASGRRAAAYLRHVKAASRGRTFTLFLKDPRSGTGTADLLWVPAHDRLRGSNVLTTLTGPHRISPERLDAARTRPAPWLKDQRPLLGVLLGGRSKDFAWNSDDEARLLTALNSVTERGFRLIVTPSRRTALPLLRAIQKLCFERGGYVWNFEGENPYLSILAHADHLLVTADSTNMVGEAVATGKPVHLFRPAGGSRKIDQFVRGVEVLGAIRPFQPPLEAFTYHPIDATPEIAVALARRFQEFRAGPGA
jgi:hypothetical protein